MKTRNGKRWIGLAGTLVTMTLAVGAWSSEPSPAPIGTAASQPASTVLYQYDGLQRLVRIDYGNGDSISYAYDPAGNLLSVAPTGD